MNNVVLMNNIGRLADKMITACSEFAKREHDKGRGSQEITADVWTAISKFIPAMLDLTISEKHGKEQMLEIFIEELRRGVESLEKYDAGR